MEEAQSSDLAAIGDRVHMRILEDGTGTIESVAARTSTISRAVRTEGNRGAGGPEREQVIIANADQALFVFAATQPRPNFRLLDRFLVSGEKADLDHIVIVINKIDLDKQAKARAAFAVYAQLGYPMLYTCALSGAGIAELKARLQGRISVFTGPSGVGKTSLLNCVQPGLGRAVKQVGRVSQEGMHTTRDSALIKLDVGGYVADTPGIRNLTVWDVEPEELDAYYVDIAPYVGACRFGDCSHRSEPGCAVRQAVDTNVIHRNRYQSYLSLREELEQAYALH
ncbi:MAG: ribosome small subunit-dependent GTPase A [Chloroflexi bacterium]|nr:ribosome small subunit-dependent GTPase A [Chloroflexota bacterium]